MAYGYGRSNLPARRGFGIPGLYRGAGIGSVFDEVDRMMGSLLRNMEGEEDSQGLASFAFSPSIDLDEDDEHYELSIELPGIRKDDIEITAQEDVLVISGEKHIRRKAGRNAEKGDDRSEDGDGDEGRSHMRERMYGRFERRLRLPADADPESISADYEDGVLTIDIRKHEQQQPERRKIEIK